MRRTGLLAFNTGFRLIAYDDALIDNSAASIYLVGEREYWAHGIGEYDDWLEQLTEDEARELYDGFAVRLLPFDPPAPDTRSQLEFEHNGITFTLLHN